MTVIFRVARYTDDRIARMHGSHAGDLYVERLIDGLWVAVPSEGSWPSYARAKAEAHVEELNRQAFLADVPNIFEDMDQEN